MARVINSVLESLDAGPADLTITQAAAGGDLLFLEACLARAVPCQVMLPFDESQYIERSILPSIHGRQWLLRYEAIRPRLIGPPLVLDDHEADATDHDNEPPVNAYERCNDWMLATALRTPARDLQLVCVWDGESGDGPGGTSHLIEAVNRAGGRIHRIDITALPDQIE